MRSNMALLRRLTAAQFVRSRAVAFSSSCVGNKIAAANDSSSGGVRSAESAAPWLTMSPFTFTGKIIWRFFCCAKNDVYYFIPDRHIRIPVPIMEPGLVGSSHGWLASYDHEKGDLFLLDPITNQHKELPRPVCGKRVSDVFLLGKGEGEGEATAALMTFDSGRNLAFCHPDSSQEWTPFGGGDYESVVYSSRHRRLFCITSALKLEAWDFGSPTPRLDTDWVAHFEIHEKRPDLKKLIYIVCAEESGGELFVVVRHVKPSGGATVERGVKKEHVGPTVDFDVYKIVDKKKLMAMKDCLEGVTMFVGNNNPIVMRDAGGGGGIQPDSIYFGNDTRAGEDSAEFGVFDYRKRSLSRQNNPYHINNFQRALWFTPRRLHNDTM